MRKVAARKAGMAVVSVQTAAKEGETVIQFVEKPQLLKSVLSEQREEWLKPELSLSQELNHHCVDKVLKVPPRTTLPFVIGCPHCGGDVLIEYAKTEIPRYFVDRPSQNLESIHEYTSSKKEKTKTIVNGRGWRETSSEETL